MIPPPSNSQTTGIECKHAWDVHVGNEKAQQLIALASAAESATPVQELSDIADTTYAVKTAALIQHCCPDSIVPS